MRQYYEAIETVGNDESGDRIRIDITDLSDVGKEEVETTLIDIMAGKSYRLVNHECYHDEHGSCKAELLKEV